MRLIRRIGLCAMFLLVGFGWSAPSPKGTGLHDSFEEKFKLKWKVIRPDESHVSLKKVPGSLLITTQRGSIHGKAADDSDDNRAKNIHLLEIPFDKDMDWVATTCINDFLPTASYQQAGLIVYNDDDNYLKWDYEYDWKSGSGQRFFLVAETKAEPKHVTPAISESGLKKFWLRLTKRGKEYEFAWSDDGKKWNIGGQESWGDAEPKYVGLLAKNGGDAGVAELEVAFEFFDLRRAPAVEKK